MGGALGYDGPFWAAGSTVLPATVVGGAMGLINALGNLGGYLGPTVGGWLQDRSGGSFLGTSFFLGGALLLAGFVMLTVRTGARRRSRPRSRPAARLRAGLSLPRPTPPRAGRGRLPAP